MPDADFGKNRDAVLRKHVEDRENGWPTTDKWFARNGWKAIYHVENGWLKMVSRHLSCRK